MSIALLKKEARETSQRIESRIVGAQSQGRDLTADEQAAHNRDQGSFDRQLANIQRLEAVAAASTSIGNDHVVPAQPSASIPAQPRNPAPSADGFRSLGEFAMAVRNANPAVGSSFRMDERLSAPANVHTEQGDLAGSFLVPAEYRESIADLVFGDSDEIMNLISPEPTSKNKVQRLGDETTPWGTDGVQAYWRGGADQMTASKLKLTAPETALHECYAFVNATEELLEDAPRLTTYLTRKAPSAIRWKAVESFVKGDGFGKPMGWMNSGSLVSVAAEPGQAAKTIVAKNVAKMWSRLLMPSRGVWLANGDTLPELLTLETENGQPLWQPNFVDAPGGAILGRPVFWTEHAETLGASGDLQFINPDGYEAFRKANGISLQESIHLFFDFNVRAFRWIFRIGGQPVLSAPVTPASGSGNTKSHFVALAARPA
ncbi:MAG: phage major capsid protein [Hyphomonas sp.]|nr:phage major capsid protein [Hyphomonas sp.]